MIDAAIELLAMPKPSWQDDAATRRELDRLKDDVHRYKVAEGYDASQAAKVAAAVNERAERIRRFLTGKRCGGDTHHFWGRK
ncbi:hypothetical protein [Halomonas sp. AOP42-D1-22]|uniref:hypothetical protein n=1 Tax=Halomonas sp. AOP42-D1-22 TaxID=3457667 RepID=UPI0040337F2D